MTLAPVHFSSLKSIGRSPMHYRARVDHTEERTPELERAMRAGSIAHKLILEPERDDFAVYEGKVRNGKAWEAFEAAHAGKLIVTIPELTRAVKLAEVVRADPIAAPRLVGVVEQELPPWDYMGRACGGRPDVVGLGFTTEVKTCPDTSIAWMTRHVLRMAYHGQLAWYNEGAAAFAEQWSPKEWPAFDRAYIVAVETREPHAVTTFALSPRTLEAGRRLCHQWMERLLNCERSGVWPGYSQCEVPIDVLDDEDLIYEATEESENAISTE